jgi:hydrogenase-4 component F
MADSIQSSLPLILILLPILGAIFTVLFGFSKFKNAREITTLAILVAEFIIAIRLAITVFSGNTLSALGQSLFVDGLSALIILLVDGMVILIAIQSIRYMKHEQAQGLVTDGRLTLYYALILLFTGTMNWTVSTNHMVMLYVAMEGTTLATALLVAFYRKRASLEAGYKYILLVVVGITFALLGIVLIFSAAHPHLKVGAHALLLTEVGRISQLIPKNIALLGVAFMTVGFATKAGLVPFHAWLPDAHSEAPSPISALLSGLIIKIGAYALARTVTIFAPTYHSIVIFIAILSSASMLIGIFLALVQDDLKRMLAYSSVSQIAYVFEGLGLGTYLGIYGGLFHLVNHTLIKGLLFMSVGAIMYATGGLRRISQLGGLASKMPTTTFCFMVGALAIGGLPPFNGFMSKFTLFFAIGEQGIYWAMVISILTGFLTLACLVSAAYRVFWQAPKTPIGSEQDIELVKVPFSMHFSIVVLALLCILIGVYPQILFPILDSATKAVLAIWALGGA